ncbi:MAG: hypothetical protein WBX25_26835 [Rhodomicrobium sp.]
MDDARELPASLTAGQAIAWTLTRDKAFTLQSHYGSSLRVQISFGMWKPDRRRFPFEDADKADRALLECINHKAIEAKGTPFRREVPDEQFEQCAPAGSLIKASKLAWDAEDNLWLVSEDKCLQFRDTSIDTAGLLREFPAEPIPTIQRGKSKGRPPRYDWTAFEAECLRLFAAKPGWSPSKADLERALADWCEDQWGDQPAHSVLQERINRILTKAA